MKGETFKVEIQSPRRFYFPPSTNIINQKKIGPLCCAKFYQKISIFFVDVAHGLSVTR